MNGTELPYLVKVRDIVEQANVSRTIVYDAINKGELPVYRFGKNTGGRGPAGMRLDPRDVARWIASRREVAQ